MEYTEQSTILALCYQGLRSVIINLVLLQMKKRKLKEEKKRKELEVQKAKDEVLQKKRRREERRERYRVQDKMNKKMRRNADA